jgi:hypothetical protein
MHQDRIFQIAWDNRYASESEIRKIVDAEEHYPLAAEFALRAVIYYRGSIRKDMQQPTSPPWKPPK